MHKLMRRVALGLALPLVVGAPVLLATPAYAAMTETGVSTSEEVAKYGQEVFATASVFSGSDPVTEGTVTFLVMDPGGDSEYTQFGPEVPLDATGHATSVALVQENGTPMNVTPGSDFYLVAAEYHPPNSSLDPSSDNMIVQVEKAASTVAVLPTASSVVADLSGLAPGGAQQGSALPGGSVTFTIGGQVFAPVEVDPNSGRATLNHVLPNGQVQSVSATYSGDGRYESSAASVTRTDPVLEARVLSTFPKSKSGWYRTPVDVWFRCKPMGSELVEDCPEDTSLKKSGKGQSVTRTIRAVDGGSATVTVTGINIDRDKPEITITGRTCKATDALSGVKGKCT